MRLKLAKKLHNEDEVQIKKTGEVVKVLNTYFASEKEMMIEICNNFGNYVILGHKEII